MLRLTFCFVGGAVFSGDVIIAVLVGVVVVGVLALDGAVCWVLAGMVVLAVGLQVVDRAGGAG